MLVYSINNENSFLGISKWMKQIQNNALNNVKVLLVANKSDLQSDRVVQIEQGKECAKQYGVSFFEVSAFNGSNVDLAFETLAREILKDFKNLDTGFNLQKSTKIKKKCCK
jgi:GTPase SAR1 family protein